MPRTSIVDEEKAKEAVSILLRAPQLTVREAMNLADFTKDEALMQRKVAQSMQMKAKKAILMIAHASVSVSTGAPFDVVILDEDGVSPNREAGWDKVKSTE